MDIKTIELIEKLTKRDNKSVTERALKTAEEAGELAGAVLSFSNAGSSGYKNLTREDALTEVADVIMCAMSVAFELGYNIQDINKATLDKLEKWANIIREERRLSNLTPKLKRMNIKLTEFSASTCEGAFKNNDGHVTMTFCRKGLVSCE